MKKNFKNFAIYNTLKNFFFPNNQFHIIIFLIETVCICLGTVLLLPQIPLPTLSESLFLKKSAASLPSKFTIVIDAGHGGKDPGKVGVSGTLEKDINLKIALYLRNLLQAQDIEVILTRDEDEELSTSSTKRKASDMKQRVSLIEGSDADAVISIHQNSYTAPQVYGAQCFYYSDSKEGKALADILQNQIINSTNQTKIRTVKSNNDYYLLKYSPLPTVIVECGFLSNPEEEKLLLTEKYQRKMAWAIHMGIIKYLNSPDKKEHTLNTFSILLPFINDTSLFNFSS